VTLLARLLARLNSEEGGRVSPAQAQELQQSGAVLVDVRTPGEFQAGHAPGARSVPLDQLPGRLRETTTGRQVVICESGRRSASAAALLRREGADVVDVSGGMAAWRSAGLPVVRGRR
jgi:rhodanese-related sulfurtransferase